MPDVSELSERELEILRLVATGASNKEIAQQLTISPNTVKVHLKNIFFKIGVASRTEAAIAAVNLGLVQTATPNGVSAMEGAYPAGAVLHQGQVTNEGILAGSRTVPRWRSLGMVGTVILLLLAGTFALLTLTNRFSPSEAQASPSPAIDAPRWQARAALPTARSGLAVTAFENRVYAIGGETDRAITGKVERYDPEENSWSDLAQKPVPVTDAEAAVIGGLIYVPGGRLDEGQLTAAMEVYDPFRDRWEQRASLPVPLSAYALTAYEGKLYLFGGWDGKNYQKDVYTYDPAEDTWSKLTPMPTARAYAGASVAGGRIYVIGGFDGERALAVNEAYQPARDHDGGDPWFKMKPMPEGRYAMGVISLADIIHLVGGEGQDHLPPLKYFPQVDDWQVLEGENTDQLNDWSHLQLAPIETSIYALGGLRGEQPSGQNMAYQAIYTIAIPVIR
jgi:DNA-binding CsgD family transcriptional regulator